MNEVSSLLKKSMEILFELPALSIGITVYEDAFLRIRLLQLTRNFD